jgi:ribosomal subunit interface protein
VDITVSARHMDISPALRAAADEKFGRLSRFGEVIQRAEVHFCEEKNPRIAEREICEVMLVGGGHVLRCKVTAADAFTAIDLAISKLLPQLQKLKTKLALRPQPAARRAAAQATGAPPLTVAEAG